LKQTRPIVNKMYQSKIRDRKKRGNARQETLEPDTDDGQAFGLVTAMLGNGRLHALCEDGNLVIGRIAGSLRKYSKKVIIERGDLILISHRDYEPNKVDVIGKYSNEQMNQFLRKHVLPEKIAKAITHADSNNFGKQNDTDDYVLFAAEEEEEKQENTHSNNDDEDWIDIDAI
jgi:translation initiation factor 1A